MATSSLGGVANLKVCNFRTESSQIGYSQLVTPCKVKYNKLESFCGLRGVQSHQRLSTPVLVSCVSDKKENEIESVENVNSEEKSSTKDQIAPVSGSFKVESLLTTICDTTSIAEVELKIGGFRLYVKRDLVDQSISPPAPTPIVAVPPTDASNKHSNSNGSASASSLALDKPKSISGSIQNILETASDEGLVILQSPKVGFFRTSRTIKGKRAPPSCKEKQEVKEGQVLCFVEQLGGEVPIESDVSGEVIKILRKDGEPIGYGDALIAILPSFPGIKKLQ